MPPNYAKRGPGSSLLYSPDAFSSAGGPLQVSYANFYQPISSYVKLALQKLGLDNIAGLNSGSLLGFSEFTLTVDPSTAVRSSSETSFLQAAIDASTLKVYHRTVAKKIIFDSKKRAKSVLVETAGVKYELSARKEVILSAGVVGLDPNPQTPEGESQWYPVSFSAVAYGFWHRSNIHTEKVRYPDCSSS